MRLAVIGSRSWVNNKLLVEVLDSKHAESPISLLVTGGAKGADTLAIEWAKENGISTLIHWPDYKRFKKQAPIIRNRTIVLSCDRVLAFWEGVSTGTQNALKEAVSHKIEVEIVRPNGDTETITYAQEGDD